MLQRVRELLRRPGYLLVVVPNFAGFLPRLLPSLWSYWDPARHLWQFETDSLVRLLRQADFEPVRVARQNMHHPVLPEGPALLLSWVVQPTVAAVARLGAALGLGDQLSVVALTSGPEESESRTAAWPGERSE